MSFVAVVRSNISPTGSSPVETGGRVISEDSVTSEISGVGDGVGLGADCAVEAAKMTSARTPLSRQLENGIPMAADTPTINTKAEKGRAIRRTHDGGLGEFGIWLRELRRRCALFKRKLLRSLKVANV